MARSPATALLVEAGAVLATSLDPRTTMSQVAKLTVPELADLCTIDLLARDGSIAEAAVAASRPGVAEELEALRASNPLRPDGEHPVARVIRGGEPELRAQLDDATLRSFAEGDAHAAFMVAQRYRSATIVPLLARGRTLGALSTLRFADAKPYTQDDLALVCELGRRAALAIDNALIFSELQRIEQRLEAVLVNLAEAVTLTDESGGVVFANGAAAELVGASSVSELIEAPPGEIARRLLLREESGAEVVPESLAGARGEPLVVRATVRAEGEERWLLIRSCPLADPETGRPRWSLTVYEDITEVKRAQLAQAQIAHTLQQALLPSELPEIPGVEIAVRYTAAGELNEAGGDFYDVIEQGDGRWLLVIGDVCGKGPRAAGVTALARHTLRAGALAGLEPLAMLRLLHEALRRQPPGADLCTACLVTLVRDADRTRLSVALAGHPQPLLIGTDGWARPIGRHGTLLGVVEPLRVEERSATLSEGESLLLYTDGVAEAGRSHGTLSEQGLIELCAAGRELSLSALLASVEEAALLRATGPRRDDIALMGVRLLTGADR
ncbi:MAG: SpoIIE family protein phosphatase [Solirubrobacteraceae bacterium]